MLFYVSFFQHWILQTLRNKVKVILQPKMGKKQPESRQHCIRNLPIPTKYKKRSYYKQKRERTARDKATLHQELANFHQIRASMWCHFNVSFNRVTVYGKESFTINKRRAGAGVDINKSLGHERLRILNVNVCATFITSWRARSLYGLQIMNIFTPTTICLM